MSVLKFTLFAALLAISFCAIDEDASSDATKCTGGLTGGAAFTCTLDGSTTTKASDSSFKVAYSALGDGKWNCEDDADNNITKTVTLAGCEAANSAILSVIALALLALIF